MCRSSRVSWPQVGRATGRELTPHENFIYLCICLSFRLCLTQTDLSVYDNTHNALQLHRKAWFFNSVYFHFMYATGSLKTDAGSVWIKVSERGIHSIVGPHSPLQADRACPVPCSHSGPAPETCGFSLTWKSTERVLTDPDIGQESSLLRVSDHTKLTRWLEFH